MISMQLGPKCLFTELGSTQTRISSLEKQCYKLEYEVYNITEKVDAQNKKLTAELHQLNKKFVQVLCTNYSEVQGTLSVVCKENKQLKHNLDALKTEVGELKSQLAAANRTLATRHSKMKGTLGTFMAETKAILTDEITNKMAPLQRDVSQHTCMLNTGLIVTN